ncbi:MAG: formate dehydrogenase accessory protein FdhE [Nitrospirae bacterium]|nr:MAG: formate dehydrogenase accessory protein FdhE [Nitrospirota bacterium]
MDTLQVEELAKERPYLKEILELYNTLRTLEEITVPIPDNEFDTHVSVEEHLADEILIPIGRSFKLDESDLADLKSLLTGGNLPFREVPSGSAYIPSLPFGREEQEVLLFLLSRPLLRSEKAKLNLDGVFWEEGRCPTCNGLPVISFLEKEEKRRFHCSYCGTRGPWRRTGCPNCGSENPQEVLILSLEGEDDMKIYACRSCKSYLKGFPMELLAEYPPELLDILSTPLDVVAQEKGYKRLSPNPVGMIKMS